MKQNKQTKTFLDYISHVICILTNKIANYNICCYNIVSSVVYLFTFLHFCLQHSVLEQGMNQLRSCRQSWLLGSS